MANDLVTFKTLLSKGEYARLAKLYSDKPSNLQINYYFDTSRFTLKASEILLRVRKREDYELTLRRKKGYKKVELTEIITEEEFKNFIETGQIPSATIEAEISELIKGQTLTNYMSKWIYKTEIFKSDFLLKNWDITLFANGHKI